MVRTKRKYTPKIRGCYECSQRRVHCDLREPGCAKCEGKGIKCSGFGIRYRFRDDTHKKYAQCKVGGYRKFQLVETSGDLNINSYKCSSNRDASPDEDDDALRYHESANDSIDSAPVPLLEPSDLLDLDFLDDTPLFETALASPDMILSPIEGWHEFLFVHYADRIAPEMVTIDDCNNGWRYFVLPLAQFDSLVRDAVLAASAFHFSSNLSSNRFKADTLYQNAIATLRKRQNLDLHDIGGQHATLMSLLVLMTSSLVHGNSDFRRIWNLIESAVLAFGGELPLSHGELGLFLVRQIRKYRGYVQPFLDQKKAVTRMSMAALGQSSSVDGWECFQTYYRAYPQHSEILSTLFDLQTQACSIYTLRAHSDPGTVELVDMVEHYKRTLEALPDEFIGQHTLVFSTFMVAAEATQPDHQDFFERHLLQHHKRNGFGNILHALEYLRAKWAQGAAQDWTEILPDLQVFIV